MKRTANPKIGGVLAIISGALGLLGIFSYTIGLGEAGSGFGKGDMPPFVPSIIFGLPIPSLVIALVAIAGGILAINRKSWPWSIAGSIAALLSFLPFGIPAMILIAMSKEEFV